LKLAIIGASGKMDDLGERTNTADVDKLKTLRIDSLAT
jgi:hypothetical protein